MIMRKIYLLLMLMPGAWDEFPVERFPNDTVLGNY